MKNRPGISIIMPVYNGASFIENAVGDILNQTFDDYELIVVDDGSVDVTQKLLQEYCAKDSRIRFMVQEHCGAGAARNKGMEEAVGEFLLFLDSDDRFDPRLLEETYYSAKKNDTDILVFDANVIDAQSGDTLDSSFIVNREIIPSGELFSWKDHSKWLLDALYHTVWNKLYSKRFIDNTRVRFGNTPYMNDEFFHDITLTEAERIFFLDKKLISYMWMRKGAVTSPGVYSGHPEIAVENLREVREYLLNTGRYQLLEKGYLATAFSHTIYNIFGIYNDPKLFFEVYEVYRDFILNELKADSLLSEEDFQDNRREMMEVMCDNDGPGFVFHYFIKYRDLLSAYDRELRKTTDILNVVRDEMKYLVENKHWVLDTGRFRDGDKVMVYGAGEVGTDYVTQIRRENRVKLAGWVDSNYEKISKDKEVGSPQLIKTTDFDWLVIAIRNKDVSSEIAKEWGSIIPSEKIIMF